MRLLSIRKDWSSEFFFGPPQYRTEGGAQYSGDNAVGQLKAETLDKRVLLLLHGYNVPEANVLPAYAKVEAGLIANGLLGPEAPYQIIIGVLWPGFKGALFASAIHNANKSADQLRAILIQLKPSWLAVETHSLGARVGLGCANGTVIIDELILTSPAVAADSLEVGAEFYRATQHVRSTQVCFSRNDDVLGSAYRYFEMPLHWFQLSSGDMALGLTGPSNPGNCVSTVAAKDFSETIHTHSGWVDDATFPQRWAVWEKAVAKPASAPLS